MKEYQNLIGKAIKDFANEICDFLMNIPEVKSCSLYGSLSKGTYDEYSDIDIAIDVSGVDNGLFITKLPELLTKEYDIIFYDYAPSLAPEKYIISVAINTENPFMVVDISCVANPHYDTVTKQDLARLNNQYDHTLKLFSANLKHHLRSAECYDDILKMHGRIFGKDAEIYDEEQMLEAVFRWLKENAEAQHEKYVSLLEKYM